MIKPVILVWYFPLGLIFICQGLIVAFSGFSKTLEIILVAIGIALIIAGSIRARIVIKQNRAVRRKYKNTIFIAECPHCGHEVECNIEDFEPNWKFQEGSAQCPVCKKTIRKTAFNRRCKIVIKGTGGTVND